MAKKQIISPTPKPCKFAEKVARKGEEMTSSPYVCVACGRTGSSLNRLMSTCKKEEL